MDLTESGILYGPTLPLGYCINLVFFLLKSTPSSELNKVFFLEILIEMREMHPKKAASPIDLTESGIVTEESASQSLNAQAPMLVTVCGMFTDVRAVQCLNIP